LDTDAQVALTGELCHCAYQAGVDESICRQASQAAGLVEDEGFLELLRKVKDSRGLNVGGFVRWLRSGEDSTRTRAFKYFVYLFGEAERRVLRAEDMQTCNHWWHRNLEDKRVVESILADPGYYKTSPRDDQRLLADTKRPPGD